MTSWTPLFLFASSFLLNIILVYLLMYLLNYLIKEKKAFEQIERIYIRFIGNIKKQYIFRKEVEEIINEDIKYQTTKLTGNFEKDKPIHWRLKGYKFLKQKFKEKKK